MAKKNNYFITVKVIVETEVEIKAENYEAALIEARKLNPKDIVDFDTSYNDGSVFIKGIYNLEGEELK